MKNGGDIEDDDKLATNTTCSRHLQRGLPVRLLAMVERQMRRDIEKSVVSVGESGW